MIWYMILHVTPAFCLRILFFHRDRQNMWKPIVGQAIPKPIIDIHKDDNPIEFLVDHDWSPTGSKPPRRKGRLSIRWMEFSGTCQCWLCFGHDNIWESYFQLLWLHISYKKMFYMGQFPTLTPILTHIFVALWCLPRCPEYVLIMLLYEFCAFYHTND